MEITRIAIEDIKPYPGNAKEHPEEQIRQIMRSIEEFGNNDPIAVDESNVVIEGHGRLMALKRLGYEEAECIVLSGLTEEQKDAYRLVHNQLTMNSGWDMAALEAELAKITMDMEALGFPEIEAPDDAEASDDDFDPDDAIPEEPVSKRGDVWILGGHRLMCGDSTSAEDVSKLMGGEKADLIVTDPPYNVAYEGANGLSIQNDDMPEAEFREFLTEAFSRMRENSKPGAAFYIWHAETAGAAFRLSADASLGKVRETLIWNKNSFTLGRQDYQWKHEPCLYGWTDGAAHYFVDDRSQSTVFEDRAPDISKMKKGELVELLRKIMSEGTPTTVIDENKPVRNAEHPTMKPVRLIGRLVKNSSRPGELVLDLFGGSGSTMIACEQLGRRANLMELDPKYCDVIIKRWESLTGKKAELSDD